GLGFTAGTLAVQVRDRNVDVEGDTTFTGLPGSPAPAHAKVSFKPGETRSQNRLQIDVAGPDLFTNAGAILTDGALAKLTMAELRLAGSEISGVLTTEGGNHHVSIQGKTLDLARFLETRQPNGPLTEIPTTYEADFNFDRVVGRFGVEVTGVT